MKMNNEDFSNMVNWDKLMEKSNDFKNQKPFNFSFIEEFFNHEFYERLYSSYPKFDSSWNKHADTDKFQLNKTWNNLPTSEINKPGDDPTMSEHWNKLKRYVETDEFVSYFRDFSGVPVTKCKYFFFMGYQRGGFQLPHIHNVGPSTLIIMLYFSKNWKQGDPGGTYMASEPDESSIIFEPYNLDNTIALFHDSPNAAHGVRYISKDIERCGFQITLEGFSEDSGWSAK